MAKIVIEIKDKSRGFEVGCRVIPDDGDRDIVSKVADKVGKGLAGHVLAKVNEAVKKRVNLRRVKMSTENKQFTEKTAPEGYWIDAKGVLTPVSLIKDTDQMRDDLVRSIVEKATALSAALAEFKLSGFSDIGAFVDISASQYGVSLGGKKGNVTLYSYDGRYKVQRAMQDRIAFDERLQAAKSLIDECLADWTENARPEIRAIITRAFQTEKEGEVNTGAVLALRRLDITDARWVKAMEAIGEAVQVVGSRSYIRVYERVGESDQYRAIPLDIAGVGV